MTPLAFVLVLFSACFHATWNMIGKKSGVSLAFYALLVTIALFWTAWVPFVTPLRPFPQPLAFYAWLGGVIASEFLYAFGLKQSYRRLDMSTAYPMMRALPLLLLAAITAAFGLGKPLGARAVVGMAVVFTGCLLVPLDSFSDFRPLRYVNRDFGCVLLVALGTTGYTLCDSQAQRVMVAAANAARIAVSKPMVSLSYYFFRDVPLCAALWTAVLCGRGTRSEAAELWRRRSWMPLAAGCCSTMTYALVLMAMNFATNVAYVQAFRQIGLVFGLLEGALILRERCRAPKLAGIAFILVGLAVSVL